MQETETRALIDLVMRETEPTERGRRLERALSRGEVEEVVGRIMNPKADSKHLEDSHLKRKVMLDLGAEYSQGIVDVEGLVLGLIQIAGRDAVVSAFTDYFSELDEPVRPVEPIEPVQPGQSDHSGPVHQDTQELDQQQAPEQPEVVPIKRCENCGTTSTPLWRKDRHVNMLLCNACGIYYKNHGRHRPVELAVAGFRANGERGATGIPSGGKASKHKLTTKKRIRPVFRQEIEQDIDASHPDRRRSTRYRKPRSYLMASDDEYDEYDYDDGDEERDGYGYGDGDGESSEPSRWAAGMAGWARGGIDGAKTMSGDSQGRKAKHRRRESMLDKDKEREAQKDAFEQSKSDLSSVECVPSSASIPPSPPSRFDLVKDDAIAEKLRVQLIDRLVSTFVSDAGTRGGEEGVVEGAVWSLASLKRARLMDPATGATWGKVRLYADPPYNAHHSNKTARPSSSFQQVCDNCATTSTPLWRKDRESGQVLCNACGIYLKTHGRHRPIGTSRHKIQDTQGTQQAVELPIVAPKVTEPGPESFSLHPERPKLDVERNESRGVLGGDAQVGLYHPATLLTPAIRGARLSRPPRPPSQTGTLTGLPLAPPPPLPPLPPSVVAGVSPQPRPPLPYAPALFKAGNYSQPLS
jgi:hypothetical protein